MKTKTFLIVLIILLLQFNSKAQPSAETAPRINVDKDLLLVQYDCKTDVDDLHSVAAFRSIINNPDYSGISYHAVAGTYGIQEGLYVPPNELFEQAFGNKWSDAHSDFEGAVQKVVELAATTLKKGGNVWIAEAGQSDFTAAVVKAIQNQMPGLETTEHIHVVQHSDWNENVTTPELLAFVRNNTSYHKIPDGNAVGNGTPGFRSPKVEGWKSHIRDPELVNIWHTAIKLGIQYNGKEGRYNNEAVAAGGLDFSDTAEVCWMLGLEEIRDAEAFFTFFGN